MRRILIFAGINLCLILSLHAENGSNNSNNNNTQKKYPTLVNPVDQTDIYAIPLDEDAQDQEEELEELEHPSK